MGGSGRVGFGKFGILWPKPNPTHHKKKKKFITQPNPPSLKTDPAGWVRSGQFLWVSELAAHPYMGFFDQEWKTG